MSDLQMLARQKAEASVQARVDALPSEIQAIQRELNARGLLRSGAMLKRVRAVCIGSYEEQAKVVTSHYEWALSHALAVSQSWVETLIVEAQRALRPLHAASESHINKAASLSGRPELSKRLLNDIEVAEVRANEAIAASLRSRFAERRRGLIRSLPALVSKLISKVFTGAGG